MKQVLVIAFLFLTIGCFAQSLVIHTIPREGVQLDTGWKFHAGDNTEWAKPEFDDRAWATIDPLLDVHHSLPQIPRSGISWLRIHLAFDSALLKRHLSLVIEQSIASEIYLNDSLICKLGVLSASPGAVTAYDPLASPVVLPSSKKRGQVLAIRFALETGAHYTTLFMRSRNPAFHATIQETRNAFATKMNEENLLKGYNGFMVGLLFLLLIIHSAYYYFYPQQQANLYFSIYAGIFLVDNICLLLFDNHYVANRFYTLNLIFIIVIATNLFLLTAIYKLLDQRRDWIYWSLLLLVIPALILNFVQYDWGWHLGADVMTLLVNLAIAKLTIEAVRKRRKGSWLLAVGVMCFLVFFLLFVIIANSRPDLRMLANILFVLADLSIPVTTSLYLGLDFGFVSVSLREKLKEVSELSEKNIQQEQEKQQILAAQNEVLETQVSHRTTELRESLENLKNTQAQLIQSEKMASLGELTAGIAHEIQNPLNFVNNFSEVTTELLGEMKAELVSGNTGEAIAIANDLEQNLQKINHHGKRADSIVKGMLQHSKQTSGLKEATDINALCDEYLRLSFHGFKAKDDLFNATINTDFDTSIGKTNLVPQAMGKALLNLFNNALYAVNEKGKAQINDGYQPTIKVSTRKLGDRIEISIEDNGDGIRQKIADKIFQPFFTTKPAGQGTGLGLSLAYDIVTKEHLGQITINKGNTNNTEFLIQIPVQNLIK
ncbi:MAG: ATP-binding protein [Ferruginibacter sp.]|nr:ATP-binding protein [Ferruginibacter sp.]